MFFSKLCFWFVDHFASMVLSHGWELQLADSSPQPGEFSGSFGSDVLHRLGAPVSWLGFPARECMDSNLLLASVEVPRQFGAMSLMLNPIIMPPAMSVWCGRGCNCWDCTSDPIAPFNLTPVNSLKNITCSVCLQLPVLSLSQLQGWF